MCLNMSGYSSNACLEKRPENRRHCKGSCIDDSESDYGWTEVVDGRLHSVYIDQEGNERFYVSNLTHKAEFLETASANNKYAHVCAVLVSFSLYIYNIL